MAQIYTEHAAWGNHNGLSGLNVFTQEYANKELTTD